VVGLQGRIPKTSASNWFQCWMVIPVLDDEEYLGFLDERKLAKMQWI